MGDEPQKFEFSDQEAGFINDISLALSKIDRRVTGREGELAFPAIFTKIIEIFKQTRNAVFHTTDIEGQHDLPIEIDLSLETPELRLGISTDKRGSLARTFGIHKNEITTKILVLTNKGYRITTAKDLDKHRFITGGTVNKLRTAPYGISSILMISGFLREFHRLLQQAAGQVGPK
ncbi:MAG: hypothetical protein AAB953_02690 [Patescibacteria group bacterium]